MRPQQRPHLMASSVRCDTLHARLHLKLRQCTIMYRRWVYVPVMTSPSCAAVMENLLASPLRPACLAARYRLSSALPALRGRRFSVL